MAMRGQGLRDALGRGRVSIPRPVATRQPGMMYAGGSPGFNERTGQRIGSPTAMGIQGMAPGLAASMQNAAPMPSQKPVQQDNAPQMLPQPSPFSGFSNPQNTGMDIGNNPAAQPQTSGLQQQQQETNAPINQQTPWVSSAQPNAWVQTKAPPPEISSRFAGGYFNQYQPGNIWNQSMQNAQYQMPYNQTLKR